MTPKEKASKLVDKFKPLVTAWDCWNNIPDNEILLGTKQCALIAVDEILELPVCWYSKGLSDKRPEEYPAIGTEEYWQEVKTEIEKL